ncbi:DUF4283 domain protein, partial [Trifolium medium]|nr:DUF4283 domain protein [Trifolium medium]
QRGVRYDPEASNNVDKLVDKLEEDMAAEMEEEECIALREKPDDKARHRKPESMSRAEGQDTEVEHNLSSASLARVSQKVPVALYDESTRERMTRVMDHVELPILSGDSSAKYTEKRTKSWPPGVNRFVVSGPWSLEWLHDHNHGDAEVIFSRKRRVKDVERPGSGQGKEVILGHKKRKAGGMLRHKSLKKVARLPCKDRREMLKILKKNVRRCSGRSSASRSCKMKRLGSPEDTSSSASVNNDWKNLVVIRICSVLFLWQIRGLGRLEKPKEVRRGVGKSVNYVGRFKGRGVVVDKP